VRHRGERRAAAAVAAVSWAGRLGPRRRKESGGPAGALGQREGNRPSRPNQGGMGLAARNSKEKSFSLFFLFPEFFKAIQIEFKLLFPLQQKPGNHKYHMLQHECINMFLNLYLILSSQKIFI